MVNISELKKRNIAIAVVGLGYVGLPLAVAFAKYYNVIAFDVNQARVDELRKGHDSTREVESNALSGAGLLLSHDPQDLQQAGIIIIAVPTPIDRHCQPDLSLLIHASSTVGQNMRSGCVVVYESTVYPGVTEDVCVPLLEKASGLRFGTDFKVGYSPERINPGDKVHTLESITKIVAGSDSHTLELLSDLYGSVVQAGIHRAASIKIAEAAKVIENTQRDINIALINELAMIFEKMNIDTASVLEAAGTKWNFLPFRPGLVGGHCIGVDPYYLTYKAEEIGYHPEIILAGRRVNDGMGKYVAEMCVKKLIKMNCRVTEARVAIMGLTFKENVPDIRNSKIVDIVRELEEFGVNVLVHDPLASKEETLREYGITLLPIEQMRNLDAIVLAVPHEAYKQITPRTMTGFYNDPEKKIIMDIKGFWNKEALLDMGYDVWRL